MSTFITTPKPSVEVTRYSNGAITLKSGIPLPSADVSLAHIFDQSANAYPERVFIRQRATDFGEWREIRYKDAQRAANGLAQWLIDHEVGFGDSVAYLSGPSIEHAIAAVGVQRSGAALAPISVAYSLMSSDHKKLQSCVKASGAKFAIVDNAVAFEKALRALSGFGIEFISIDGEIDTLHTHRFGEVISTQPTAMVHDRMEAITADTTARIMYTSGSTGSPKAVPQPQSNLTVTVAQVEAIGLLNFGNEAPQILEAMPFSHIMAGNFNFNNIVRAGGIINIDEGKPTPELFHKTIENLREISPHFFITVPLGFSMLCDAMETDDVLRLSFFRNLKYLGFGGAVLSNKIRDRLLAFSRKTRGEEVPIFSFYGATEYLFGALKYWVGGDTNIIGLPLPGIELKLIPENKRYALWIKSPALMPRSGYIGAPEISNTLFDDDGFFNTGDAVVFSDKDNPNKGLVFAGRISEDFKLSSGTFVSVDSLKQDFIEACQPLIHETVVCGLNEDWIGVLVWLSDQTTGSADGKKGKLAIKGSNLNPALYDKINIFNQSQSGSSRRIGTVLIMSEPLSFDNSELTVKGNVSAQIVRQRRFEDVVKLFQPNKNQEVIDFR